MKNLVLWTICSGLLLVLANLVAGNSAGMLGKLYIENVHTIFFTTESFADFKILFILDNKITCSKDGKQCICKEGYQGKTCSQCENGFSKINQGKLTECKKGTIFTLCKM